MAGGEGCRRRVVARVRRRRRRGGEVHGDEPTEEMVAGLVVVIGRQRGVVAAVLERAIASVGKGEKEPVDMAKSENSVAHPTDMRHKKSTILSRGGSHLYFYGA